MNTHILELYPPSYGIRCHSLDLYLKTDIFTLESVQHKVTKTVSKLNHLVYNDIWKAFHITRLTLNRTRSNLIQMYKISKSLDTI